MARPSRVIEIVGVTGGVVGRVGRMRGGVSVAVALSEAPDECVGVGCTLVEGEPEGVRGGVRLGEGVPAAVFEGDAPVEGVVVKLGVRLADGLGVAEREPELEAVLVLVLDDVSVDDLDVEGGAEGVRDGDTGVLERVGELEALLEPVVDTERVMAAVPLPGPVALAEGVPVLEGVPELDGEPVPVLVSVRDEVVDAVTGEASPVRLALGTEGVAEGDAPTEGVSVLEGDGV